MAILVFLHSPPIILNPRSLLAAHFGAATIPAPTDPWFLGRRRRHWQDGRHLAGSGQHLAQLGSSPKVAAFPCGWGIWLSAAPKSPTWNALCISLEGSQTVLWKLQLVASHKQHPALTSGCYVMLFMGLFQVMEFHCLSGALATGSTYIFSALWFFPLNCTDLYIWASALETFHSAFILQFKSFKYVLLGKLGGESKGSRDSGKRNLVFTGSK